jgi:uncharacterized protein YoxC
MTHLRVLALAWVAALAAPSAADLAEQKEKQRQLQAETEKLLRRVKTTIRVLEYNRLGASGQKALLDEVARTLSGVSREQMTALLAALEKGELSKATDYHEKVVLQLKSVLARFDAVRDLGGAADRLEKLARDQAEQSLAAAQAVYEIESATYTSARQSKVPERIARAASEQVFLRKDFALLLEQVGRLKPTLPAE